MNFEVTAQKATRGELIATLRSSFWALLLPVIIIGGFRLGLFTPTEAGAVAAVYAFIVAKFIYRELKWGMMYDVTLAAGKTVAVVLFLFAASSVTGYIITLAEIPDQLLKLLEPLIGSPTQLIIVIMLVNLLVGMVMDLPPMILIMIPILTPVLSAAHVDPYYFALLFMVNGCIGLITPPVGNALNAVSGIAKVPFLQAARGVLPFLGTHLFMLSVFIAFPQLVMVPLRWFYPH
jgi:tripartite ATP-independent transporter DctM subunit